MATRVTDPEVVATQMVALAARAAVCRRCGDYDGADWLTAQVQQISDWLAAHDAPR